MCFQALADVGGRLIQSPSQGPHAPLIAAYWDYLSDVRGLAPATVTQHLGTYRGMVASAVNFGQHTATLTTWQTISYKTVSLMVRIEFLA
jgi:hypothetical protein